MRKSSNISLGLVAGLALVATSGCRSRTEAQNCVDASNHIVADSNCEDLERRGMYTRRNGSYVPYRWLFGGRSGGRLGDTVLDGSGTPHSGFTAVRGGSGRGGSGSVSRGGFGHSMGAHS